MVCDALVSKGVRSVLLDPEVCMVRSKSRMKSSWYTVGTAQSRNIGFFSLELRRAADISDTYKECKIGRNNRWPVGSRAPQSQMIIAS